MKTINPKHKIKWGKYKGHTYNHIADIDPKYVVAFLHKRVGYNFNKQWLAEVEQQIKDERDIILENYHNIW